MYALRDNKHYYFDSIPGESDGILANVSVSIVMIIGDVHDMMQEARPNDFHYCR